MIGTRRATAAVIGVTILVASAGIALAATARVRAKGEKWRPVHTYIGRGESAQWSNPTSKVHDLKAYGGGWSFSTVLDPGESAIRRFKQRGTFKFRCVRLSAIVSG